MVGGRHVCRPYMARVRANHMVGACLCRDAPFVKRRRVTLTIRHRVVRIFIGSHRVCFTSPPSPLSNWRGGIPGSVRSEDKSPLPVERGFRGEVRRKNASPTGASNDPNPTSRNIHRVRQKTKYTDNSQLTKKHFDLKWHYQPKQEKPPPCYSKGVTVPSNLRVHVMLYICIIRAGGGFCEVGFSRLWPQRSKRAFTWHVTPVCAFYEVSASSCQD